MKPKSNEELGKYMFENFKHNFKEDDWDKLTKDEKDRWCKRAAWLNEFSKDKK
jgi:hypothetical protein